MPKADCLFKFCRTCVTQQIGVKPDHSLVVFPRGIAHEGGFPSARFPRTTTIGNDCIDSNSSVFILARLIVIASRPIVVRIRRPIQATADREA